MNKYFLIILISISLIVYTNSATCSTLSTEDKCKAQKGCSWAAAATCTGTAATCATSTASKDACEGYACTFNAGDSPTCTGGDDCSAVTNPTQQTCSAASTTTGCTYTAAGCSGTAKEEEEKEKEKEDSSLGLKSSVLISLAFLLF